MTTINITMKMAKFGPGGITYAVGQSYDVEETLAHRFCSTNAAVYTSAEGMPMDFDDLPVKATKNFTGGIELPAGFIPAVTAQAWSSSWNMAGFTDYGDVTVTGALAITSDDTSALPGGCSQAVFIANGINIPTFDGSTISDYQNTNGSRNLVQLFRGGNSKFWAIGSRLGAALSLPVAPAIGVAPVISTAVAGSPLTFSAASGVTGSPTPTVTYDAMVGGSVVSAGITSGSYTPPTSGVSISVRATATNSAGSATATSSGVTVSAGATAPGAPTIGTATAGDASASITFTAPASDGGSAITGYTVTSSPGGFTGTGASSPINVTGLANGTAYTFTVTATNAIGTGSASAASNSVTPVAAAYLRFSVANGLAESGTGPYNYLGSGANFGVGGFGVGDRTLASSADGWFGVTPNPATGSCPVILFKNSAGAARYNNAANICGVYLEVGAYKTVTNGTGNGTPSGVTTGGAGESYRMRRAGTTAYAERTTNGGSSWDVIHTWTGITTGILYPSMTSVVSQSADSVQYSGLT